MDEMKRIRAILIFCICVGGVTVNIWADEIPVTVSVDKPIGQVSPTLHGIFFEDINYGADGGLYPERVKNGSFEFTPDAMMGWRKTEDNRAGGTLAILDGKPLNANNPHFLRLTIFDGGDPFGISNEGFHGIGVENGAKYKFSVYARQVGDQPVSLQISILDAKQQVIGTGELANFTGDWKQYSCEIESAATVEKARLLITSKTPGAIDLDMVSLYPESTWGNRPNGLRPDLVQLLKDLKPKFLRFPGGCIVEGRFLSNRYQWKNTIGDLSQRKLILNRWNTEFAWRQSPDYFQSFGLGFYEYFQLCEDIGAKPLPILNCGMACQFNSGELAPLDEIQPYIQDALDLVEFANGSAETEWGKKRAAMGHPAPFNLDRIGVGNEQWGPQYIERLAPFAKAMKEKYPDVKLIAAAGPFPKGREFDYAWRKLPGMPVDFVDEHYYANPQWFLDNANRYDNYDRKGLKIFAGEFAAQSVAIASPDNKNNWECALAEAAFMTGLERNSDVVAMSSYAPLFAHVDGWQWTPDLIWFDNLRSFGTPNYYVQKLFSTQIGTTILPVKIDGQSKALFSSATRDDASGDVIIKLVNTQSATVTADLNLAGMSGGSFTGTAMVLSSDDLHAVNSLDEPTKIAPAESKLENAANQFKRDLPGYSVTVLRVHAS
jgi:alpha-N-arabinofuranosidase